MATKTKDVECVGCGAEIQVSLFMSAAKAKCESCKKPATPDINIDGTYATGIGPRIDGAPNEALRLLGCPYHPKTPMSIIGVVKSSMGDISTFQCREKGCWTLVKISEQQTSPVMTSASGIGYEPDDLVNRWPRTDQKEDDNEQDEEV